MNPPFLGRVHLVLASVCETRGVEFNIRTILGDEWRLWRSLRLRAVDESPDAFRSVLAQESAEADEWWRGLIASAADHPHGLLLVAEADSDPVGMMFGRLDDSGEVLDVGAMWVDPEMRRKGIGRGLLDTALDWARAAGASKAELWVTAGNDAAKQLYETAAFALTGDEEPLRHGSELTVCRMETPL